MCNLFLNVPQSISWGVSRLPRNRNVLSRVPCEHKPLGTWPLWKGGCGAELPGCEAGGLRAGSLPKAAAAASAFSSRIWRPLESQSAVQKQKSQGHQTLLSDEWELEPEQSEVGQLLF